MNSISDSYIQSVFTSPIRPQFQNWMPNWTLLALHQSIVHYSHLHTNLWNVDNNWPYHYRNVRFTKNISQLSNRSAAELRLDDAMVNINIISINRNKLAATFFNLHAVTLNCNSTRPGTANDNFFFDASSSGICQNCITQMKRCT